MRPRNRHPVQQYGGHRSPWQGQEQRSGWNVRRTTLGESISYSFCSFAAKKSKSGRQMLEKIEIKSFVCKTEERTAWLHNDRNNPSWGEI